MVKVVELLIDVNPELDRVSNNAAEKLRSVKYSKAIETDGLVCVSIGDMATVTNTALQEVVFDRIRRNEGDVEGTIVFDAERELVCVDKKGAEVLDRAMAALIDGTSEFRDSKFQFGAIKRVFKR